MAGNYRKYCPNANRPVLSEHQVVMNHLYPVIAVLIFLANSLPAQTNAAPLPPLESVIQRALNRAAMEDDNDRQFNQHYGYTRVRVTEYRNAKGELKKHEEKRTPEGLAKTNTAPAVAPKPVAKDDAPVSDNHSNIRGKQLAVKDYSLTNLVTRFQFTLVGRETVNGRSSLVLDFQPAAKHLPARSYKDKFINKAAGRVWVDEVDYAIAKADLHLTQPVNVLGGVVGAVWKFTYSFERTRTPEGLWFARHVDWHLEGREVIFHRIVDYHEQKIDEQPGLPPTKSSL
jgi:hypothetical protein